MSQRTVRITELVKRELSSILRRDYRTRATPITVTGVEVSPDLRHARVFYSVIGDETARNEAGAFLASIKRELRQKIGQVVILKYTPELRFVYDTSIERGNAVLEILDELDRNPGARVDFERGGAFYRGQSAETLAKDIREILHPRWFRKWFNFTKVDLNQPKQCALDR